MPAIKKAEEKAQRRVRDFVDSSSSDDEGLKEYFADPKEKDEPEVV